MRYEYDQGFYLWDKWKDGKNLKRRNVRRS